MDIVVGERAGFCEGVKRAVEIAKQEVKKQEGVITYCLGDLVHNPEVMNELEKNGLKVINNLSEIIEPNGKKVIFRAHGVKKQIYEEAEKLGLDVIDLTCPKVLAIHKLADTYVKQGDYIFLFGEKNHPEVIGTSSFCGKNCLIIETEEDLDLAIEKIKKEKIKKVLVISQTTFSLEKFEIFAKKIENELGGISQLEIKNTVCQATRLRQDETENLSKKSDYMIIIGGKKSSNTNKLYDISIKNCKDAVMIETANELSNEMLSKIKCCDKIGIMAGASTPQNSIIEVKDKIEKIAEGKISV